MSYEPEPLPVGRIVAAGFAALLGVIALIILAIFAFGSFGRWQTRTENDQIRAQALLDAQNKVAVTEIEIQNQAQNIQVTQQKAQIRYEEAVGVRKAQDEISSTLTPLYVQFEMVEALKQIADSGKNNTVVYIPSGANGIPLVSGAAGQPAVGSPDGAAR